MPSEKQKTALIIGAGPAGLTAALELLKTSSIHPIVLEMENFVGGISRTVEHNGNRMDIGGHRFFSKSDVVMNWWKEMDKELMTRPRLSRILYMRKFFDYPVRLNKNTVKGLGLFRMAKIGLSYLKYCLFPIKPETNLQHFMLNRFGRELYLTFFKDYTEKVWGIPCEKISAEWGAQRIKGLSIAKTILHALLGKSKETSLIEEFLYPKLGPGYLWQLAAEKVKELGGEILFEHKAVKFDNTDKIVKVSVKSPNGEKIFEPDFVISSMPIKDLANALSNVPPNIKEIANGLLYRDFITVGLLLDKLEIGDSVSPEGGENGGSFRGSVKSREKRGDISDSVPPVSPEGGENGGSFRGSVSREKRGDLIKDNWIYVQESDVKVGRLQIFNNWSEHLVADKSKVWIGMEYFCNEGDEFWEMSERVFAKFAISELEKIGVAKKESVRDFVVVKVPKTYPAYFGSYNKFPELRSYLDGIDNLFLVGRNGMHRYNNMDHSMLTAIEAVRAITQGKNKDSIWAVNSEDDYHEGKK